MRTALKPKSNVIRFRTKAFRELKARDYKNLRVDTDMLDTLDIMDASGLTDVQLANKTGISLSTFKAWRRGKTKRPQNATLKFALHGCGYERQYVKIR